MTMYNGVNKITIQSTQYAGLGFANTNPAGVPCWRVIDRHDEAREASVGPLYKSKAELLEDLPRYAKTWGY
jgi:hypothetical protein